MPDQAMIERMARAVRDEIAHPRDGEFIVEGGFRGDDYFVDIARAVLAAMREPSSYMIEHGDDFSADECSDDSAVMQWRSWIDAALSDDGK